MNVVAIIPARGGSKGLPDKNILKLNNMPMIWYTLSAAAESQLESIIISSDNNKILEISKNSIMKTHPDRINAFHFHKRPENLATDTSVLPDVINDVIDNYQSLLPDKSAIMLLQPTSPVRKNGDIDHLISQMSETNENSIVAVSCPLQHPGDMVIQNKKGIDFFIQRSEILQRQQYKSMYFVVGSHYLVSLEFFKRTGKMMDQTTKPFIIEPEYSIDVDDISSFHIAEAMIKYLDQAKQ